MKNVQYVKKYYEDENVYIYLHFVDEIAVRQIEVFPNQIIKLSSENPICQDSFLYDQNFSDIEWSADDFISEEEFEDIWNKE